MISNKNNIPNNQWNDFDSVFEKFIDIVIASCKSEFCQININFLDKKWDNSHSGTVISTSDNIALITNFTLQQQTDTEVFDLTKDNRFNQQKVIINDLHIKHFFGIPLLTNDGLIVGFICIMDTKPKRFSEYQKLMVKFLAKDIILQIEVLKRDYQLQEVNQLRDVLNKELDEFTYIASHDLASPLNAIKSLISWVEEDTNEGTTSDNPKYFKMIKNSIERMHSLLKDLARYSRISRCSTQPEHLNLKAIIAESCEFIENTSQFEFQVNYCELELPKQPLMIILKHMISNSVKHHHKSKGVIQINAVEKTKHYQISITDNGPGIAPVFHSKIFKPFQTLKPKDEMESSGLGLAIVKKILGLYRGNITINSEVGSGATFTITWPKSLANNN